MKKVVAIYFDRDSNIPSFELEDGTVKHPIGRVYLEWLSDKELEEKKKDVVKKKWYDIFG